MKIGRSIGFIAVSRWYLLYISEQGSVMGNGRLVWGRIGLAFLVQIGKQLSHRTNHLVFESMTKTPPFIGTDAP